MSDYNNSGWKLVSHDPVTGMREWETEVSEGVIITRTEYYVAQELVDANRALANENDGKRWGNGQIYASVPLNTFYQNLAEPMRQGDRKYLHKWLNDSDHSGFRTFNGRV